MTMANKRFIVLACDGGGVRGLITAKLLKDLDPAFLQQVSLFSGTSTGSIIALGLAGGVPIEQIEALYRSMSDCNTIFTPYLSSSELAAAQVQLAAARQTARAAAALSDDDSWWWKLIQLAETVAAQLAFPKYKSDGIQKLLTSYLPALTVAQLASQRGKYAVVPSFQINSGSAGGAWKPALFHNLPGLTVTPELASTSLIDAALCSAAAPLFFGPHTIPSGSYIDGGIFANNPCSTAIAAYLASSLNTQEALDPTSFAAVSIGTGDVSNSYPPPNPLFPYGMLGWLYPYQSGPAPAFPLIQAMFDGGSAIDDLTSQMILRNSTYIRANPVFDQTWSLDDCASLDQMNALTDAYIKTQDWQNKKKAINALVSG
jgi:patatin-like phospholipase/acyl hydrolase